MRPLCEAPAATQRTTPRLVSKPSLYTGPFLLAGAANLLHGLSVFAFLHLPGFLEGYGASPSMVGFIFGALSGAAMLVRPFAGRAMDIAGRRIVILVAGVVHVIACSLYLTVDGVGPWIVAVRCIHGLAQGSLFSAFFTYAADIVPPSRRSEGIGIFGVSGMLPMALGGLLGDIVLRFGSYRILFGVTAGVALLALLVSIPLPEPERDRSVAPRGFFSALVQPDLLPIWFVGTIFATALAAIYTFLKSYVSETGLGSVGLFFAAYAATTIVLRMLAGSAPDRFGPMRVFYPAMLSLAIAMLAMALAKSTALLLAGAVLAGIGHGFIFPILTTLVVDRANPADRGSAVSLFTAVFDAGIFAGGPILGWIAGPEKDYRQMYLVAGALPLLGAAAFHLWDRRVRPPGTPTIPVSQ